MADDVIDLSTPETFARTSRSRVDDRPQVSALESLLRGAAEGATFGFDDKLGLDRDARERSRAANPWTHFAGEMVGGIAPIVATGGIGAGIRGTAVAARASGLVPTSVARAGIGTANALEAVMLPGQIGGIGSAALQGSKLGAVYGGLSGAGHADVDQNDSWHDALVRRAMGAGTGTAVGTVLGAPLGVVGHGIGRAAQNVMAARAAAQAETADATAGSLTAIARGLERDRLTPEEIIQQIRREFPDTTATAPGGMSRRFWGTPQNRQPWTDGMIEDVVRRHRAGESVADISEALSANGRGPGAQAVRTVIEEIGNRNLGPLNIVDRASMVRTGSGDNTQMTLRAAAATPGQARAVAREDLLERQIGARDRLLTAFERRIGSADFDGVAARHEAALEAAEAAAYARAHASAQPFDLQPIINQWQAQYPPTRRGPIPEAVNSAIVAFVEHVPVTNQLTGAVVTYQLRPPQTLQQFIDARQNMLAEAMRHSPGVPRHRVLAGNDDRITPETRRIMAMRGQLSAEVRRTNPEWGVANDLARDGRAAGEAMSAGARQGLRLNARSRDNLREFTEARDLAQRGAQTGNVAMQQAGEARMELFRVGLMRSLYDLLANPGETHNLTRVLRLPGARQIIGTVLGDREAATLYRVIDAEHAMHRTYASQFGSQTTPLREAIDDLSWAPRFATWLELLNPKKALAAAGDWASTQVNAGRNQRMMPLLTETDPLAQLEMLRSLGAVARARGVGNQTVRRPLISATGPVADVAAAELMPKPGVSPDARLLSQARNALLRGAPRQEVESVLRQHGVDPAKLGRVGR